MDQIGYDAICSFVANVSNRNLSGFSPDTIKTDVQNVKQFFAWLEDGGKWKPTCNYGRLLRVNKAKLVTPVEQSKSRSKQETFTSDEMAKLYTVTKAGSATQIL